MVKTTTNLRNERIWRQETAGVLSNEGMWGCFQPSNLLLPLNDHSSGNGRYS
jgi:hypothetical protein